MIRYLRLSLVWLMCLVSFAVTAEACRKEIIRHLILNSPHRDQLIAQALIMQLPTMSLINVETRNWPRAIWRQDFISMEDREILIGRSTRNVLNQNSDDFALVNVLTQNLLSLFPQRVTLPGSPERNMLPFHLRDKSDPVHHYLSDSEAAKLADYLMNTHAIWSKKSQFYWTEIYFAADWLNTSPQSKSRIAVRSMVNEIVDRFVTSNSWPQTWYQWSESVSKFLLNDFDDLSLEMEPVIVAILDHAILRFPFLPTISSVLSSMAKPQQATDLADNGIKILRPNADVKNQPNPAQYFPVLDLENINVARLNADQIYLIPLREGSFVEHGENWRYMFVKFSENVLKEFRRGRGDNNPLTFWHKAASHGRQTLLSRKGLISHKFTLGGPREHDRLHDPSSNFNLWVHVEKQQHPNLGSFHLVIWNSIERKPRR